MKLSILIPTTPDRKPTLDKLLDQFERQGNGIIDFESVNDGDLQLTAIQYFEPFEVLILLDSKQNSIGTKRNILLQKSAGEYICFVDSDDRVSDDYIQLIFDGIRHNPDACSLIGVITVDGQNPKRFIHSKKYTSWYEQDNVYYRNNNHLNVVRGSIARKMKFPDSYHGEDKAYSTQLMESGLIKTEYFIDEVIYFYEYVSQKPA